MQTGITLLKVLIIDDEPFIRKGLSALIDWESEGYYIADEASNGTNALKLLRNHDYDLIISDIKMPDMDGIELITYIKSNNVSKAKFVFLSGFYDFQYAKTAIQYGCCDYILKPILKDELLSTIRKIMEERQKEAGNEKWNKEYEKAYLDRHLQAIVWGKCDSINLKYAAEKMQTSDDMAYFHFELSLEDERFLALDEDNRRALQRKLYNYANLLLKKYPNNIIYDIVRHIQCYDIGIIYCSDMAKDRVLSQENCLKWLLKELSDRVAYHVEACTGRNVNTINEISDSYREAVMLRSFRYYRYNDNKFARAIKKDSENDYLKKLLDELIHAIEINDVFKIKERARALYRSMMDKRIHLDAISRNIQYLLYRLLGLAYDQDADINQEEIMQYIRETVFTSKINYENEFKFQQFVIDYADYLTQLRQSNSKGMIDQIEKEIEEKYSENLSLKLLGEKYYINSAYLGQIFKKRYGCAFKDYLINIRVRKAAEMMLYTDKKIYEIAVDVGYKNQEYFINKFEEIYGATPTRFRKRNTENDVIL